MAPKRKSAPQPPTNEQGQPQLEEPDARIRIVLAKWGQATEDAIAETALFAPGWSSLLQTFYGMVDDVMSAPVGQP